MAYATNAVSIIQKGEGHQLTIVDLIYQILFGCMRVSLNPPTIIEHTSQSMGVHPWPTLNKPS